MIQFSSVLASVPIDCCRPAGPATPNASSVVQVAPCMRASSECSSSSLLLSPCLQNIWIRYSAVGFVCGIAQEMGDIDTACFLTPRLEGYLRQPVMDLSNHYLLLSTLKDPLLRPVYDYVLKQSHLQDFFDWWASNTCSCTCVQCVSCVHVCMCVLCTCVSCVHVCV